MNKKKSIWSGVSVLIAAVLAIVAFVRSDTQIWLLTAAFTIWAIWVTAAFVFPYIRPTAAAPCQSQDLRVSEGGISGCHMGVAQPRAGEADPSRRYRPYHHLWYSRL